MRRALGSVIVFGFVSLGAAPPRPAPFVAAPAPDLVAVTDSGKVLDFQSRSERRFAFWARNAGDAPAGPNRIRLKFYHRSGWARQEDPWTLHADLVLDVPALKPGEESKALVSRLLYRNRPALNIPPPPRQYRWEFFVDDLKQVSETNEGNNSYIDQGGYNRADALETGPSGKFH